MAADLARTESKEYDRKPIFADDARTVVDEEAENEALMTARRKQAQVLLTPLLGRVLDDACCNDIGLLLGTFRDDLRCNRRVQFWNGTGLVWAQMQVYDILPMALPSLPLRLYVRCTAGTPIFQKMTMLMSRAGVKHLMREAGAPKFPPWDQPTRPEDVCGLYCTVLLRPGPTGVKFIAYEPGSSELEHNKALLKLRREKCPGTFAPHKDKVCQTCPLSKQECPRARFVDAWLPGTCMNGHEGYTRRGLQPCLGCLLSGRFPQPNAEEEEIDVAKYSGS